MTYVPYIYVKHTNGFIDSTKFMKECDLNLLKPGDSITSFYDETFPLYNIYLKSEDNSCQIFQDNTLKTLSQEEIKENIQSLFPQLLSLISVAPTPNLLNDYKKSDGSIDRPSVFKEYMNSLEWNTNSQFHLDSPVFSLENYTSIANELCFYADCLVSNVKLAHFVKGSVKAFNTFLAYDGIVEDFSNGMFSTDREDNEKEVIYFSTALNSLHYAQRLCDASIAIQDIKPNKKKLKL